MNFFITSGPHHFYRSSLIRVHGLSFYLHILEEVMHCETKLPVFSTIMVIIVGVPIIRTSMVKWLFQPHAQLKHIIHQYF